MKEWFRRLFLVPEKPEDSGGQAREEGPGRRDVAAGTSTCFLFLLDRSGSMDDTDFPPSRIRAAVNATLSAIRHIAAVAPRSYVGVGTFSTGFHICTKPRRLADQAEAIEAGLDSLGERGWTHMGKGLAGIRNMMKHVPEDTQVVVIILTDGRHNGDKDPVGIARDMKDDGADLWAIGIGGDPPRSVPVRARGPGRAGFSAYARWHCGSKDDSGGPGRSTQGVAEESANAPGTRAADEVRYT